MSQHVLAHTATFDMAEGFLTIDDVRLPWWLAHQLPEVDAGGGAIELRVSFIIDGAVTVISEFGDEKVYDKVIGDPAAWARAYVRGQLREAFPDLELP